MKSITAERVIHKGESRIALRYSYDTETDSIVRRFPGARWSMTMKCWHLPDNQSTREKMVLAFGDILSKEVSAISGSLVDDKSGNRSGEQSQVPLDVRKSASQIQDKESCVEKDEGKVLHTPASPDRMRTEATGFRIEYGPVEFTINETDGRLIIRFTGRYDQEWIKELNSYGRVWFDSVSKEWLMSWTRMKVDSLSDYFATQRVEVIVKRAVLSLPVREQRQEKSTQYSASYHNQLISAINMYYKLNGSSGISTESLGRPRRGRSLPKVF